MEFLLNWFKRNFSNPQVVFLALILLAAFAFLMFFGNMLAPVLAGVVIAYLLEGVVRFLERHNLPRLFGVVMVLLLFVLFVVLILFGLLPLLSRQIVQFLQQVPAMFGAAQQVLLQLPQKYPDFISADQLRDIIVAVSGDLTRLGQEIVSMSLSSVVGLITFVIYVVLLPILVFFFLKDKDAILGWFSAFFPRDYQLTERVWGEVHQQISNYIRGKFWEILIVGVACFVVFSLLGMQYPLLLGVLIGLSVLIPYVGAAIVTLPVMMVAWFQWGWSPEFFYVMVAYLIIQALDGYVLVPLLFSEVVNLHPVAIIFAVLFFGGLWGVWGVFFAIPLATLVQAVLRAWPRRREAPRRRRRRRRSLEAGGER